MTNSTVHASDEIGRLRQQKIQNREIFISCVVPVYNEEVNMQPFLYALIAKLKTITSTFEIIVVDDGSTDMTSGQIKRFIGVYPVKYLGFSRNFGKECALSAGLQYARGEVVILIDADFQHPLELIERFLAEWKKGYDMVYGARADRKTETHTKRIFSNIFYHLMRWLTKENIPADAGDYRLLDRKVVQALNACPENNRFMKGLYAWVGFESVGIAFEVPARAAGKSSWHFSKLFELALTGITAFSEIPLRISGFIGLSISAGAFAYMVYTILHTLIYGVDVPGYATLVSAVMFFGGIQLLSIGVLGEYLGRVYNEVKRRPLHIIARRWGFEEVPATCEMSNSIVNSKIL